MGLTVRERKALADIEQALVQEDPRLARQLARMRLTRRTEEQPAPPGEPAAAEPKVREQGARESAAPTYEEEKEPGTGARRIARWCAALALVLLVVSDLAASSAALYAAGATALVSGVACVLARSAARRE